MESKDQERSSKSNLLDPFQSRLGFRLKHDVISTERRQWYASMEQPVFRHYRELQDKRDEVIASDKKDEEIRQREERRMQERAEEGQASTSGLPKELPPSTPWLLPLAKHPPRPSISIFFFPEVGCAPSMFDTLLPSLSHLEGAVYGVCPPGRMHRVMEPLSGLTLTSCLIGIRQDLLNLLDYLSPNPPPWVFVGHGLGAVLAFETARLLQAEGISVALVVACGSRCPMDISHATIDHHKPWGTRNTPPLALGIPLLHELIAQEFISDPDLAQRKDLLRIYSPVLDADQRILKEYICLPPLIAAVPLHTQLMEGFRLEDCAETMQSMGVGIYRMSASLFVCHGNPESWQTVEMFSGWEALTNGSYEYRCCDQHGRCVLGCGDCQEAIIMAIGRVARGEDPSLSEAVEEQDPSENGPAPVLDDRSLSLSLSFADSIEDV